MIDIDRQIDKERGEKRKFLLIFEKFEENLDDGREQEEAR